MRYYSEETVKQIVQEVKFKEIQCNIYDNFYSVQRIYPNLDMFESIDIPEPHGRLIDVDKLIENIKGAKRIPYITSEQELIEYLELYAILDKFDHTIILEASKA